MDVSTTPVAERIARVLAGQRISANAGGDAESAGDQVDRAWRDYLPDAVAVLRTLREPDQTMAAAGDPAVWERMVLAAIRESKPQTVVCNGPDNDTSRAHPHPSGALRLPPASGRPCPRHGLRSTGCCSPDAPIGRGKRRQSRR